MRTKPVCVRCKVGMRTETVGALLVEMADFGPSKVWRADVWKCPGCGNEVVSGYSDKPVCQDHWEPDFLPWLEEQKANGVRVVYENQRVGPKPEMSALRELFLEIEKHAVLRAHGNLVLAAKNELEGWLGNLDGGLALDRAAQTLCRQDPEGGGRMSALLNGTPLEKAIEYLRSKGFTNDADEAAAELATRRSELDGARNSAISAGNNLVELGEKYLAALAKNATLRAENERMVLLADCVPDMKFAHAFEELRVENKKLCALLAEKYEIYLQNCAEIDRLSKEVSGLKSDNGQLAMYNDRAAEANKEFLKANLGLARLNTNMIEEIDHIKNWVLQDQTGLTLEQVCRSVAGMCDDAMPEPAIVIRGHNHVADDAEGSSYHASTDAAEKRRLFDSVLCGCGKTAGEHTSLDQLAQHHYSYFHKEFMIGCAYCKGRRPPAPETSEQVAEGGYTEEVIIEFPHPVSGIRLVSKERMLELFGRLDGECGIPLPKTEIGGRVYSVYPYPLEPAADWETDPGGTIECPNCGTSYSESDPMCPHCGSGLGNQ